MLWFAEMKAYPTPVYGLGLSAAFFLSVACNVERMPAGGGGLSTTASNGHGSSTGDESSSSSGVSVAFQCVSETEPTRQPWSNDIPPQPLCVNPTSIPLPTIAVAIDLSSIGRGSDGTCSDGFLAGTETPTEIDASLGFPQVLKLPAVQGRDPACDDLCVFTPTSFGLTVNYLNLPLYTALTIRVPAPWFLVIGNEHSPTPCLDGGPSALEYGKPLACVSTGGNHVGFATADALAPSVEVLVDAMPFAELPQPTECCPYTCQ